MADYRFSAKSISRGKGQSAIASAAYRSGERLMDERTGQSHDYTRRSGVIHAEIVAPDNTPDWMHDRAQLWNSVEAVERRKDAQLAREIQLSLPHELTDEQRVELVRGFTQEQFVNHGMIADIAIHAPSAEGDARNHHAHVMLTMRELTGDGFGKKVRDWNSSDLLANWREQWAQHQNRQLERHGHPARVDHRSYEAQGVDREPTQHLGPVASDMERKGKASRIGDENRAADRTNSDRAMMQIEGARLASQKARFETWAQEKKAELHAAQDLGKLDLSQKHDRQRANLEDRLSVDYGQAKATVKAELHAVERRLEAGGVIRKAFRNMMGRTRTDKVAREQLTASLTDIRQREGERRQELLARQAKELARLEENQRNRQKAQRDGITKYRDRQEAEGWRTGKKRGADSRPREEAPSPAPQKPTKPRSRVSPARDMGKATNDNTRPPEPPQPAEPSERLALDDRKRISDAHINEGDRNKLEKPWRRASAQDRSEKPWRKDRKGEGRTRTPFDRKPPK